MPHTRRHRSVRAARTLRLAIATVLLPLALWACNTMPLGAPVPLPEEQSNVAYTTFSRKLDLVFMIDDSPSMGDKQENLARNFPGLVDELKKIPGGLPDVHIAVLSSDLGAGPKTFFQCMPGGDRGVYQVRDGCGLDPGARFITASDDGKTTNFGSRDISDVFACMARLGQAGCGEEHQLESLRLGLDESATPQNQGFLRTDAYLAIILVTDEDDCSAPADTDLFFSDIAGQSTSLRCALEGHLCNGLRPPAMSFSTPLAQCKPVDNGKLISVSTIVDSIKALKTDPGKILVSAISGWSDKPGAQYRYGLAGTPPLVDYLPICTSNARNSMGQPWTATAALRIKQFVDAFGANGIFADICADDYRPAMTLIGDRLVHIIRPDCIDAPLVDTKPDPGVQPDCVVSDLVPKPGAPGGVEEVPLPRCDTGKRANGACWNLTADATCTASGFKVDIDRGNTDPATASQVSIKCATCAGANLSRCPH